ncbi:MAG TPA: ABC transporter ATP-binding protein [Anaerolineales bacterium]|nr:ABC transporter ATP-binding protein [Anaerolineales bacterium]
MSGTLRKYRFQVLLALLTTLGLTAVSLAIPRIIQQVIDNGLAQGNRGYMLWAALAIAILGLITAGLTYTNQYLSEWVAAHIGYDLRNRLYDQIQYLSFSYHDHSQTGQLISRCIEDVRAIERFTGLGIVEVIRLILLVGGITTLLFIDSPRLAVIALFPLIPLVLITTNFGRKVGAYFLAVDQAIGDLSSRLQENVSGAQVVRAFAREDFEIERFATANRRLYHARIKVNSEWSKIMPTSNLLVTLGTIAILWFGGRMVIAGEMTIGEVVAFNSYLLLLAAPAQQLTWLVNAAGEAAAGAQRAFEILETIPEIKTPREAIQLPILQGRVNFENVSFNYSGKAAAALADIDLQVKPNQLVALIGPTGSGKTSLVNLIPRFYDASAGTVSVDGIDVRKVDLISLRRQIGIVLQTSLLFSVSIHENIAYGRPDASLDEVIAAAKAAQADEFIRHLPLGYETIVGERGVTLSGGQRQRIAIARAVLMDPRILILDDSTSSVDTQTENLIQQALDKLMEGRTSFVIAHRLSTVRRADLILVLDHGQIVERGTHKELLRRDGLYRQIYDLQLHDRSQFYEDQSETAPAGTLPAASDRDIGR